MHLLLNGKLFTQWQTALLNGKLRHSTANCLLNGCMFWHAGEQNQAQFWWATASRRSKSLLWQCCPFTWRSEWLQAGPPSRQGVEVAALAMLWSCQALEMVALAMLWCHGELEMAAPTSSVWSHRTLEMAAPRHA